MKNKVLICEPCHPIIKEELEQAGYECDFIPTSNNELVKETIHQYYGLIVRSKVIVDSTLLYRANKLAFIGRVGSGMELIDQEAARQKGILCFNSPEGNKDSVAEHVVGSMIVLLKNIHLLDHTMRENQWLRKDKRGYELGNKTVGIIGFGNTGSALAQKLSGFGCKILAYDKYKKDFGNTFVIETDMDHIFTETDVLSVHLPLTPETKYLVDSPFLNKFKKNIYFINTSRGPIMNTNAVVNAIDEGKILGAALDVFEEEPLFPISKTDQNWFEKLRTNRKVVFTPHIAGVSNDAFYKLAYILSQKIKEHPQLSADSQN